MRNQNRLIDFKNRSLFARVCSISVCKRTTLSVELSCFFSCTVFFLVISDSIRNAGSDFIPFIPLCKTPKSSSSSHPPSVQSGQPRSPVYGYSYSSSHTFPNPYASAAASAALPYGPAASLTRFPPPHPPAYAYRNKMSSSVATSSTFSSPTQSQPRAAAASNQTRSHSSSKTVHPPPVAREGLCVDLSLCLCLFCVLSVESREMH